MWESDIQEEGIVVSLHNDNRWVVKSLYSTSMKQDEIPQNNVDKSEKLFCVTDYSTHLVQPRPVVTNVFYRKSENEYVVHDSFLFRLLSAV
jgi:hypothetical protein